MSAYREQKTNIKDPQALVAALKAKGFNPIRHTVARQLEGYHGDLRQQTAEIIIPRKQVGNASNDIGFKKQPDGSYVAIISQFDSRRYDEKWLNELKALVTEKHANRIAVNECGLEPLDREVLSNGHIRLRYVQQGR